MSSSHSSKYARCSQSVQNGLSMFKKIGGKLYIRTRRAPLAHTYKSPFDTMTLDELTKLIRVADGSGYTASERSRTTVAAALDKIRCTPKEWVIAEKGDIRKYDELVAKAEAEIDASKKREDAYRQRRVQIVVDQAMKVLDKHGYKVFRVEELDDTK